MALAAAACGSSTGVPATTAGAPHPDATAPPSPFVQTVIPDTPVGGQLAWLLQATAQLPIPTATVDAHFAPSFLAQADPAKINTALTQLAGDGSPTFVGLLPGSPLASPSTSLHAVVTFGTTTVTASLALDASGRIAGLLFSPYVPATLDSWTAVDGALAGVAPVVGLVAARIGPSGTCASVHGLDASVARPTGSMFKLFVLGAVATRIATGSVHWDQELTLTDALRSAGSGTLRLSPAGTRITVRQAADLMISQSDNTAADLLIDLVGRSTVEDRVRAWSDSAARDQPFRGSGVVGDPEFQMVRGRKNMDFFANAKAQAWWALRLKFQNTYRAIVEHFPYNADDLISIDPALEELQKLAMELSQVTYSLNSVGKILVDKAPDGMRSPNLADAVMIAFNPSTRCLETWTSLGRKG